MNNWVIVAGIICCPNWDKHIGLQMPMPLQERSFLNVLYVDVTSTRGRITVKCYGVNFTCMASREVHLKVANSLDTDGCINALWRLISQRGQVVHIRSDNGKNFISANRELKEAITAWNDKQIERELLQAGVQWSNPLAGSHYGGAWERIIRMLRNILCSVLHQQTLDD